MLGALPVLSSSTGWHLSEQCGSLLQHHGSGAPVLSSSLGQCSEQWGSCLQHANGSSCFGRGMLGTRE